MRYLGLACELGVYGELEKIDALTWGLADFSGYPLAIKSHSPELVVLGVPTRNGGGTAPDMHLYLCGRDLTDLRAVYNEAKRVGSPGATITWYRFSDKLAPALQTTG
ncbi:MAG TPA: hypothetical protein VF272_02010 [Candidatus Saccharimonadia bacterium]